MKPSGVSVEMGTLGVIIAMCVCAHAWKCGVYLHFPHTVSYSFLPCRPHFFLPFRPSYVNIWYISYSWAFCDIYHIYVYNTCIHKSTYRSEDGYLSFCIWLILFNMMLSSSIHLCEWFYSLQLDTMPSCISHIFLIHSYVVGCLDWFCILTIVIVLQ